MVDFSFIVSLYVSDLPNVTISTVHLPNVTIVRVLYSTVVASTACTVPVRVRYE